MALIYATASGTGDGTSSSSPMELQAAFDSAVAGDTVYFSGVFGGQSSNVEYTISNNGTLANPINIEGRRSDWSAIVNNNTFSSLCPDNQDWFNFEPKTDLPRDGVDIPYLQGFRFGARNSSNDSISGVGTTTDYTGDGTGINITGDHINFKNILIEGYGFGLRKTGTGVNIENVNTTQTGDYTSANSYDACNPNNDKTGAALAACPPVGGQYWGRAIIDHAVGGSVSKCAVFNAGAEGVQNRSNGGHHHHNFVFERDTVNSNDYHYLTTFAVNSIVEDIEIFVHPDPRDHGHGNVLKWATTNGNIVRRVKVTNNRMEMQYQGVSNNVVEDFEVIGGTIAYGNGASLNTFKNGSVTNPGGDGATLENWSEDGNVAPFDNKFEDVRFFDSKTGFNFSVFDAGYPDSVKNTTFENCEFDNLDYLAVANRANVNTILKNCKIKDVTDLLEPAFNVVWPIDLTFVNCEFENSFAAPFNAGDGFADDPRLPSGSVVRVYNFNENKSTVNKILK